MIKIKVRCIDNREKLTLTINSAYIVYGGEYSLNDFGEKYNKFIVENDNGSVMPYEASSFDIILDIDDNYIVTDLTNGKFKFIYNKISDDKFWEMFYNDVNIAISNFNIAKRELYINELNDDEIKYKLTSSNILERDFIADTLSEYKNSSFITFVADFCNEELNKWINYVPIESLFNYLKTFKTCETEEFFYNYLLESDKGHKALDDITYKYFEENY